MFSQTMKFLNSTKLIYKSVFDLITAMFRILVNIVK